MEDFKSPKENIAENQVIAVQEAQTLIKEAIIRSYKLNIPKEQLSLEIKEIIKKATASISRKDVKQVQYALAQNAQRWEYTYRQSLKVINATVLKTIERLSTVNPKISNIAKSYNVSLSDYLGLDPKQQNQIIGNFRNVLTQDARGLPVIESYESIVKSEVKKLATDPANVYRTDRNGNAYKMNLRNYAEMRTRYEANQRDLAKYAEDDKDLVWTSSHPDSSMRCAPYQGKLYSIKGRKGTIDGIPFTPLSEALEGPKGDGNGIINGYNCRHRLIPYTPKSRPPQDYDEATVKKENELNNRQRLYERSIRNLKLEERALRINGDNAEASRLRKRWQRLDTNYKKFSLNNGRAFYEWRTRILSDEEKYY
jgi:hypothetical protein